MTDSPAILIGSETQHIEGFNGVTGIQRVVHECHAAMEDAFGSSGIEVVPLHTLDEPRRRNHLATSYGASDPVLQRTPARPDEVDAFLFLDLHARADFSLVHREKRRRPRPIVSLVHDLIPIHHPEWFVNDPIRTFRIYLQQVIAVSDHLVVASEKVKSDLQSLGWRIPGTIHVLGLGTSFRQRLPEPNPDDRISILYVSTIEPRKGHETLLDAFDLLRVRGLDVDLALVGHEGWKCERIVQRIRRHPDFGGRLRWYEGPDDLTIATLARGCSIGVFPSSDEGFGLFLEEGLSQGLKMVVSDIPVFRERAQPNVTFAEQRPQAIADAIVLAHATEWEPIPAGGLRTMRDFGSDIAEVLRASLT